MEILKNQLIVLQFVNFGGERERQGCFLTLSLSLPVSLSI